MRVVKEFQASHIVFDTRAFTLIGCREGRRARTAPVQVLGNHRKRRKTQTNTHSNEGRREMKGNSATRPPMPLNDDSARRRTCTHARGTSDEGKNVLRTPTAALAARHPHYPLTVNSQPSNSTLQTENPRRRTQQPEPRTQNRKVVSGMRQQKRT